MKTLVTIFLFVLVFYSSKSNNDPLQEFIIAGEITGGYDDYIYLNYPQFLDGTFKEKDSTKVINDKFEFKGTKHSPVQGWVNLKPSSSIDESRAPFLKVIAQDSLNWKKVIDVAEYEGKTAKDYFLFDIPYGYLVDDNGKIIQSCKLI